MQISNDYNKIFYLLFTIVYLKWIKNITTLIFTLIKMIVPNHKK